MRVIAGAAGGVSLHIPRTDLRPTMDMVKGAIFSSLGDAVIGARVLDLFAGTGGLGIEALSRGAASATFVESDRRAVTAIGKNLEKTRLAGPSAVIQAADIFRYLDRLSAPSCFDLILADPPYAKSAADRDFAPELIASDSLRAALAPAGIFILEHLPGVKLDLKGRWTSLRDKRYGATAVAFLQPVAAAGDLDV